MLYHIGKNKTPIPIQATVRTSDDARNSILFTGKTVSENKLITVHLKVFR